MGRKSFYYNYMGFLKVTRLIWTSAKNMSLKIRIVSLDTDLQAYFITEVLERMDQRNVYFPPSTVM